MLSGVLAGYHENEPADKRGIGGFGTLFLPKDTRGIKEERIGRMTSSDERAKESARH
jgi:hypothetical protein